MGQKFWIEQLSIMIVEQMWVMTYCAHAGQNLNLYSVLAPDAYPQLQDYVNSTKGTVVSQVYDVRLFHWFS